MTTYIMQAVSSTDGLLKGWQSPTADFIAAGFPGPGSATHVAVAGRTLSAGAGVSISKFPNDVSAFARWNFEGDGTDSSGNGRDLTLATGTFIDIYPGFPGLHGVVTAPEATRNDQNFRLPGDITIISMFQANAYVSTEIIAFSASGSAQSQNYQYQLGAYVSQKLQYFSEHGSNLTTTLAGTQLLPYIHNLVQVAMRRSGQKIQFWINGLKSGAESAAQTTPDGGTTATLNVLSVGDATVGAIEFYDRALSDAEVAQRYNVTMGGAFGTV